MNNPVVEMEGDEMAQVLWRSIRSKLIEPFVHLKTDTYDLSLPNRDATDDLVTLDAANAVIKHGAAAKAATITPDAARVSELNLKRQYRSPNATIRSKLDGTVVREGIAFRSLPRLIPHWNHPIVIARHGYGDQYAASDHAFDRPGSVELTFKPDDGSEPQLHSVCHLPDHGGIALGMHNTFASIEKFARTCFELSLSRQLPLCFGTKDTIMKQYDGAFREVFDQLYEAEYKERFEDAGLSYEHMLIDDLVARILKSKGGFVWATKNFEGDVMSDLLAQECGSLALMKSELRAPGLSLAEAAHGTIKRHYDAYKRGESTSSNGIASITAWGQALAQRGRVDGNKDLTKFAEDLERSVIETVDGGKVTKDLAALKGQDEYLETFEFLDAVADQLKEVRR